MGALFEPDGLRGFAATASFLDAASNEVPVREVGIGEDSKAIDDDTPDLTTDLPFVGSEPLPESVAVVETEPGPEPEPAAPARGKRRTAQSTSSQNAAPAKAAGVELEPDEGIDWSLPDFPDATGDPEAPSGAPVVIDQPLRSADP